MESDQDQVHPDRPRSCTRHRRPNAIESPTDSRATRRGQHTAPNSSVKNVSCGESSFELECNIQA